GPNTRTVWNSNYSNDTLLFDPVSHLSAVGLSSAPRAPYYYHSPSTAVFPLSLHDALPIYPLFRRNRYPSGHRPRHRPRTRLLATDRKSTRLNSSHVKISYAVFCLKKKIII